MRNRTTTDYALMAFVISIALLVFGLALSFYENNKIIDPKDDVIIVKDEGNTVSVTTTHGNNTPSSNTQNNTNDNSGKIVLDKTNEKLRNEIQKKYSVSILYGKDTIGYSVKSGDDTISTVPIENSTTINAQLTRLKNTLSIYPKDMFKEIKDGGIPLTIILVNNFSEETITGVTDSTYTYANISIAAIYPFEESFYHESYHYIERYMFKKGANFNSWDILNPSGFSYGNSYTNYSYSNTFEENAPFVNNYAQTAATEDRASTFEYMMASTKASCLNEGNVIWKKATYMSRTIDAVLNTVSPNTVEYWERYL